MMINVLPFSGNLFLAFWGLESPIQPRDNMALGGTWSRAWRADLPVPCQDLLCQVVSSPFRQFIWNSKILPDPPVLWAGIRGAFRRIANEHFFFPILIQLACVLEALKATVVFGPLLCQIISRKDIKEGFTVQLGVTANTPKCPISKSLALQIESLKLA